MRFYSLALFLIALTAALPLAAQETYTLGTGEETSYDYPSPYGNSYEGARHQILVRASELTALGASSGYITELGFHVETIDDIAPLVDYTIKLKQTNATEVVNTFDAEGWTTVYSNSALEISEGWNNHTLSTGFYWNGTSNLLVEVCFNNDGFTDNPSMYRSETPFNSVVYFREDESGVCNSSEVTDVSAMRPDLSLTIEQPMAYSFSGVRQITDAVAPGATDAHVLRIEVFATGSYNPVNLTNLVFSTLGTTDAADLRNARVYYTGKGSEFEASTVFGTEVSNPDGSFTISGDQQLIEGPNYFWLVYDLNDEAGLVHAVDAVLQSLTVNGVVKTPTNTSIGGARIVWPYCESTADSGDDTYIGEVSLGDMTTTSPEREGDDGASYSNYTNVPAVTLVRERSFPISVTKRSTGGNNDSWINVFFDWNRDGVFESSERAFTAAAPGSEDEELPAVYSGTIVIPADAELGMTGMRVVIAEEGSEEDEPCGVYDWGETEDYVVNILQPATLEVTGNPRFRVVGSERRIAVELRNVSPVETLSIRRWLLNGDGETSFRVYVPGTNEELPLSHELAPNEAITAEVAFGNRDFTAAGQQAAVLRINHDGVNAPTRITVNGYYATLFADDRGTDLLTPGAVFDAGVAEASEEDGPTVSTQTFVLKSDRTPLQSPILIHNYTITGPDAGLFSISTLPYGIGNSDAVVSVSINGADATPGVKHATLTINHSAANGAATTIELTGRVGRSLLQAPTLVTLQPAAIGSNYASPYQNITLVPLTQQGSAPVEITGNPVLTGSGAAMMEVAGNSGRYYIRGMFDDQGNVVPVNSLDITSTWRSPAAGTPIVVSETQPWLIAVRMKSPSTTAIPGSYNADIVFSDGMGNGISNAINDATVRVVGEVVNDVNALTFSPAQLAFGSVPVGSATQKTLTLRNQSGVAGPVVLSITGQAFAFGDGAKTMAMELPADNTPVTVTVQFMPVGSGAANGVITAEGAINGTVPMSGSGQAASPGNIQILVDGMPLSGTLDFGSVAAGQVGTRIITVVNNNVGPVTLSSVGRSGANATQFTIGELSTMTVPGNGGTATFPLRFIPTSVSSPVKSATITIYNNTGVPRSFNVRGTAVTSGGSTVSVALTPTTYNYGNQSGTQQFTLTNNGSAAVEVSGALLLGSSNFVIVDAPSSFPRTVAAGGSTVVTVQFNAQGANGLRTASLVLVTPGVTPYPTASLTGRVGTGAFDNNGGVQALGGVAQAGLIELAGNYPNPFAGETSLRFTLVQEAPVTVRIFNAAGEELRVLDLGVVGAGERSVPVQAQTLSSGTYHYTVEAAGSRVHGVMVVVK